ncbi:MAG: hydroxymethylbilane synthase [Leptospirales bacterium]|nr:hydroxymethylbilane synthase [Leptospirales bacterium]
MTGRLRIATRGSHLALAQAHYIQKRISELPNAPQTELTIVRTTGDANQSLSLSETSGGNERKGLFTKEIEDALLENKADIAVHSFKDLPTEMVPGLKLAAIPQRLEPREVLIFPKLKKVRMQFPHLKPGSSIGTSSTRRLAQIKFRFPDMTSTLLRGNVPTRIGALLRPDGPDATLLSGAGVERLNALGFFDGREGLNLADFEVIPVPPEFLVPAPAQGALAIQCRTDDVATTQILAQIHEAEIEELVSIERSVLAGLEGGCHLPLGAHAERMLEGDTSFYRSYVFLGSESTENRAGQSYQIRRAASTPQRLSHFLLEEIQRDIPIILTGQNDRNQELIAAAGGNGLISLPLIETRLLDVDPGQLAGLQSQGSVAAFFSPTGVRAAALIQNFTAQNSILAAVGNKTAASIRRMFGRDAITGTGTAEDLAHLLLQETSGPIYALQAQHGRNEFVETIKAANREIHSVHLYETLPLPIDSKSFEIVPSESYVVFASSSAFHAFLDLVRRFLTETSRSAPAIIEQNSNEAQSDAVAYLNQSQLRLVSIGGTTSRAMLDAKCIPYAEGETPDLDLILKDLRKQ